MIIFNEFWVRQAMSDLWEEMVGIRPTFPYKLLGQPPAVAGPQPINIPYAKEYIPHSDLNAARLIRVQMEDRLTYVGSDKGGRWYFWNGVYHQHIESGVVADYVTQAFADQLKIAMDQVSEYYASQVQASIAAGNAPDSKTVKDIEKQYTQGFKEHKAYQAALHRYSGQSSVRNQLRSVITKEPRHFDEDRRWLVVKNGVIDLEEFRKTRKIELLPHSPTRPVTRCVDASFDRDATAPVWEHFLETSQPDEELREFLQRLVGAAFLGESKVKAIPNLVGPKDCGKSVFVTTLDRLAGGYGIQPSPSALMEKKGGGDNWEQEKIRGKRFVGISEPSHADRLDDNFCKQVTGGDVVHTRALYTSSSDWVAQCVMFIASNHPVRFNTQDQAFLDRICVVTFPHQFFDAQTADENEIHIKDPDLERKLAEEKDGIFQWIVWGMWKFLDRGIDKPDSVKRTGEQLAVDSSPALTWVREKVEEGSLVVANNVADYPASHYALVKNLHAQYVMDSERDGDRRWLKKRDFSRHLQSKYGPVMLSGGQRIPKLVGAGAFAGIEQSSWTAYPV